MAYEKIIGDYINRNLFSGTNKLSESAGLTRAQTEFWMAKIKAKRHLDSAFEVYSIQTSNLSETRSVLYKIKLVEIASKIGKGLQRISGMEQEQIISESLKKL